MNTDARLTREWYGTGAVTLSPLSPHEEIFGAFHLYSEHSEQDRYIEAEVAILIASPAT